MSDISTNFDGASNDAYLIHGDGDIDGRRAVLQLICDFVKLYSVGREEEKMRITKLIDAARKRTWIWIVRQTLSLLVVIILFVIKKERKEEAVGRGGEVEWERERERKREREREREIYNFQNLKHFRMAIFAHRVDVDGTVHHLHSLGLRNVHPRCHHVTEP